MRWTNLLFSLFIAATFIAQNPLQAEESKKTSEAKKKKSTKKKRSKRKSRPQIEAGQGLDVRYGSSSWNQDPTKIDSAKIIIRDRSSGKMAQIQVEENAPDSALFSGSFNVNWGDGKAVQPEVYIPPKSLRKDKKWITKMKSMIDKKQLRRKPFLIKKDQKILEVYDTQKQAKSALKAYKAEKQAARAFKLKKRVTDKKSIAAKSVLEAAQLAAAQSAQQKLALEAAKLAADRIRLAQIERQKKAARIAKQKKLAAAEKKRRKARALKIVQQAIKEFRGGNFIKAEELFAQAIELDPTNKSYYFQYGVALFRNKKYNQSIVILNDAKDVAEVQRNYYQGLNYYYLKDFDQSFKYFEQTQKANDPNLSPGAAFYMGLIKFVNLEYEAAKPHFEWVLDYSKDPKLDQQAEDYIEKIAGILFFAEQAKTKYFLDITAGLTYDSNVLTSSDSTIDAGTATDVAGPRVLGIIGGKYRPVYNKHHEFALDADLVYYYSFNSAHIGADAMVLTFGTPYTHKRTLWGKGYQTTVTPAYELLYLDENGTTGTRSQVMSSLKFNWDNTFVMKPTWFAAYNFEVRMDDSTLSSSTGANDADTTKITFDTSHTFMMNKAKDKILVADFGVTNNGATGSDQKYFRFDLGATYIVPSFMETSWSNSLKYYNANYGSHSSSRADSNFVFSTSLSKPLNKKYSTSITADYTKNSSNVDANSYSKWTVLTTFSASYSGQ